MPSEFGIDPARMGEALEPGRVTFDEKMRVRKAIEDAKIPFTYVSANCFAGYFVGNLSQMGTLFPPKQNVNIYGDGNAKGTYQRTNISYISMLLNYIIYILLIFDLNLYIYINWKEYLVHICSGFYG